MLPEQIVIALITISYHSRNILPATDKSTAGDMTGTAGADHGKGGHHSGKKT